MGLLQFLQGAERQINVLDNNKTFKNKQGNGQNKSAAAQALGLGKGVAGAAIAPFSWLAKTDIVQPTKELAASLTGNKQAKANAVRSSNVNLGLGPEGNNLASGLKTFGGNTAQVALSFLAPGAGKVVAPAVEKAGLSGAAAKLATAGGTGAVVGAPFGAASEVTNNPHLTLEDILKGAAFGGVAGAGLGIAGEGLHLAAEHAQPLNEVGGVHNNPKNPVNNQDTFHVPVGGGNFLEVSKEEMSALQKAKTPEEVKKVIGDALPSTVTDKLAPGVALAKDPNIIANLFARELTPKTGPVLPEQPTTQTPQDIVSATIPQSAPPQEADPFQAITDALNGRPAAPGQSAAKGIATARAQQDELLTHERGQRFSAVDKSGQTQFGDEGYFKRRAQLKGEYTKIGKPLNDNLDSLTPEERQATFVDLQKKIYSTPDSVYEKDWKDYGFKQPMHAAAAKFNTEVATRKVLGLEPGLPTNSEIRLLRVHSPELADMVENARPKFHSLMDFASKIFTNIAGTTRALKSTGDFSMGGRQGIFVAARHPVEWFRANKESVKYSTSGQYFKDSMKQIGDDAWIKQFDGYDTGLQAVHGGHEEMFSKPDLLTGHIAKDKLKAGNLVAGAERAYTGGLSYLRATLLKSRLMKYGATPEEAAANLGSKGMKGLSEVARTLTGRGGKDGGWVAKHATSLNEALFSPRLWTSRLEVFNPAFWARVGPAGRAEAFQNLAAFASVAAMVLEAATVAGGHVETDPRSSDFLKIKVGDTRYDILGGLQQNLVFGWRELSGEKKSSTTGATTKFAKNLPDELLPHQLYEDKGKVTNSLGGPNRLNVSTDLISNKLTPALASGTNLVRGQDKQGQPVNPYTEIGQLFVPISIQGTYQTIKSTNSIPEGILKNSPDYFGISSQTYGLRDINITAKQKAYVAKLKDKGQQQAYTSFLQTRKVASGTKTNADDAIKAAIQKGQIDQAVKLAKDYNQQYAKSFADWRKQYGKYRSDEVLQKAFNKYLITDKTFTTWINNSKKGATP